MIENYLSELQGNEEAEFFKKYKKVEYLASGSFGEVIRAIDIYTKDELAVKIINKKKLKWLSLVKKEISIFQQLNHPNIVQFYGSMETQNNFYILMELVRGVTLGEYLQLDESISEKEISLLMRNLFLAVNYLHQHDIIHRDIKLENIMINNHDPKMLKLIDFGLSSQEDEDIKLKDQCGTLRYMAPELVENKAYSKEVDIWSCGIVMYMLLNKGEHPFTDCSIKEYKLRLKSIGLGKNISPMAWCLLKKLLETDPSHRYSACQALRHPWIIGDSKVKIPKTFFDTWKTQMLHNKFAKMFLIAVFLSDYKKTKNNLTKTHPKFTQKIKSTSVSKKYNISIDAKDNHPTPMLTSTSPFTKPKNSWPKPASPSMFNLTICNTTASDKKQNSLKQPQKKQSSRKISLDTTLAAFPKVKPKNNLLITTGHKPKENKFNLNLCQSTKGAKLITEVKPFAITNLPKHETKPAPTRPREFIRSRTKEERTVNLDVIHTGIFQPKVKQVDRTNAVDGFYIQGIKNTFHTDIELPKISTTIFSLRNKTNPNVKLNSRTSNMS